LLARARFSRSTGSYLQKMPSCQSATSTTTARLGFQD